MLLSQPFSLNAHSWAENTLAQMTLKEKVSQLFMPAVYTSGPQENVKDILEQLDHYPVGGILFMQGTIECQQKAVCLLQQQSKIPLLCGQDAEWGLSMRLEDALRFPRNLTLGAIQNNNLIFELGQEIAHQCQGVGLHINFAPVVDINNNPDNPVINDRSFGENPHIVSLKSSLWVEGLQQENVLACAKHFPGHGDTTLDSHLTLPVLNKTIEHLKSLEWVPFQAILKSNIACIMTGHLYFPLISQMPASLCKLTISDLLRKQLGFQGLVFTDALNMKAITDDHPEGESEVLALLAGNDMLLFPRDYKTSIEAIISAVQTQRIDPKILDEHVLKILQTKEKLHLHQDRSFKKTDLFSFKAQNLKKRLYQEAITAIEWTKNAIPLPKNHRIAFVQVGHDVSMKEALERARTEYNHSTDTAKPPLFIALNSERQMDYFFLSKKCSDKELQKLQEELQKYSEIVFGFYEMHKFAKSNFGLSHSSLELLKSLNDKSTAICVFGSPYSLQYFQGEKILLMAYENDPEAQIGCALILLGKKEPTGRLPISASKKYPESFAANYR